MKIYEITSYDVTPKGTSLKHNNIWHIANATLVVKFLKKHGATSRLQGNTYPPSEDTVANEWFVRPKENVETPFGVSELPEERFFVKEINVMETI